jgi:palmitoyl-protein thioesterase
MKLISHILFFISTISFVNSIPVVLMHGIESHAENLNDLAQWIETKFNRTVINVELGDGDDYSTDTPLNTQIDCFRDLLRNNSDILANGFDFIGISQGGLIGRGYVQKYSEFKVFNLITLVSPHGGVYDKNLGFINFYSTMAQKTLSFSGYWRDPKKILKYKLISSFLPELNGEKLTKNTEIYKDNLLKLKNFVMVFSPNDEIIKPPSSGIFSTYHSDLSILPLENNPIYINDWIGLKTLNNTDRLHFYQTNCTHVEHRMPVCFPQLEPILSKYL